MANVSFLLTDYDSLPEKAIEYLQDACDAIKGYCTIAMAIAQVQAEIGCFYCVFVDQILMGCLFINFRLINSEKKMSLVLLGSERNKLHLWSNDLKYFLRKLKKEQKAHHFSILGRPGWGRLFREFRHVACVYEGE